MSEVTRILNAVESGDSKASEELLPIVYEELRKLAAHKMDQLPPGQTLQATALVHEAYLRLADGDSGRWQNRGHFFAAAAEAMRRILIDRLRKKQSLKRGGNCDHEEVHESGIAQIAPSDELLAVNDALEELSRIDPKASSLVKLRYFVGMTMAESSNALELPLRKTERLWTYARAWLRRKIGPHR